MIAPLLLAAALFAGSFAAFVLDAHYHAYEDGQ